MSIGIITQSIKHPDGKIDTTILYDVTEFLYSINDPLFKELLDYKLCYIRKENLINSNDIKYCVDIRNLFDVCNSVYDALCVNEFIGGMKDGRLSETPIPVEFSLGVQASNILNKRDIINYIKKHENLEDKTDAELLEHIMKIVEDRKNS